MTVKLVTFKTNHTILGELVAESLTTLTIKNCVQVVAVPPTAQNQQGGIAFSPFIEYAQEFKTGFTINKSDILMTSTPVLELENQYNTIFGSGIQIAKPGFNL